LGCILRGKFRFFNTDNLKFDEIGYYVCWAHVSLLISFISQANRR
jgi:hypothetical protein